MYSCLLIGKIVGCFLQRYIVLGPRLSAISLPNFLQSQIIPQNIDLLVFLSIVEQVVSFILKSRALIYYKLTNES